jgi:hypothetical protein
MIELNVDISLLRGTIVNNPIKHLTIKDVVVLKIKDTPHYKFIMGNKSDYKNYYTNFIKKTYDDENHSPEKFQKLIDGFDINLCGNIKCRKGKEGTYIITDGLHRACILAAKGFKNANISLKK